MEKQNLNKTWSEYKFNDNILQDALFKHVIDLMPYRMSDEGEVLEAMMNIQENDEESWIDTWSSLAARLQTRAENFERKGKLVSAASSYLRASTYWRVSLMYFSKTDDKRMVDYSKKSQDCFDKALVYGEYPGEAIQIPYEKTFLPGHFYRSPKAGNKAPLLIVVPGRDTWADDTMWVIRGALQRGFHALTFDGPGQGMALRLQNLKFRPDSENVMTPVIDFAEQIEGVDVDHIGAIGLSFGGFMLPRATAFDDRLSVSITDPGNLNWGGMISERLEKLLQIPEKVRPQMMDFMLKDYEWKHDATDQTIIHELKKYDNRDIIDQVKTKTLVLDGSADVSSGTAEQFFEALTCPKDYLLFDEQTTAEQHTQMGGYLTATEYIMDWLEDNI
ncbi:alpha/beta hydrolase family protein [Companilactobacillus zhongbaensis]|uniref:alpha/beta hydrolase family protein n=1 Tax=Companilactobacillus zhongbaensis TaxID=2486009 RepID=UPI000F7ACEAC|nr:alpha/beta fold hydrolase [Companilactobacillus zhongbaensis]